MRFVIVNGIVLALFLQASLQYPSHNKKIDKDEKAAENEFKNLNGIDFLASENLMNHLVGEIKGIEDTYVELDHLQKRQRRESTDLPPPEVSFEKDVWPPKLNVDVSQFSEAFEDVRPKVSLQLDPLTRDFDAGAEFAIKKPGDTFEKTISFGTDSSGSFRIGTGLSSNDKQFSFQADPGAGAFKLGFKKKF